MPLFIFYYLFYRCEKQTYQFPIPQCIRIHFVPNQYSHSAPHMTVHLNETYVQSLVGVVQCPGHVKGNGQADRLVGKATLTSGLLLRRSGVFRSLRHYLRAQSHGHHTISHLVERGVERGSASRSPSKGRERAIVNQTNISKAMLGKLLRCGGVHIAFPSTFFRYHL